MAGEEQVVRVHGTDELRSLADQLREQADGRKRLRQLTTELRRAAKPLATAVKSSVLTIPSNEWNARHGRESLRRNIAKAVTVKVGTRGRKNTGVRVFINPKKMPDGRKGLVKHIEGTPGWTRWRHPVFGRDVWVNQGQNPFFTDAVRPGERLAVEAVDNVLQRVKRDLENG